MTDTIVIPFWQGLLKDLRLETITRALNQDLRWNLREGLLDQVETRSLTQTCLSLYWSMLILNSIIYFTCICVYSNGHIVVVIFYTDQPLSKVQVNTSHKFVLKKKKITCATASILIGSTAKYYFCMITIHICMCLLLHKKNKKKNTANSFGVSLSMVQAMVWCFGSNLRILIRC